MEKNPSRETYYANRSFTKLNFVTTPAAQASSATWNALFGQRNPVMAAFLPTYVRTYVRTQAHTHTHTK